MQRVRPPRSGCVGILLKLPSDLSIVEAVRGVKRYFCCSELDRSTSDESKQTNIVCSNLDTICVDPYEVRCLQNRRHNSIRY